MGFDPHGDYVISAPKPLPVFLLLDVSGSMYGEKISALNQAVSEMIKDFASANIRAEIKLTLITFGDNIQVVMQDVSANEAVEKWKDLEAYGCTNMGAALTRVKNFIEDRNVVPSRSYRPLVALISDGEPTDSWEGPMNAFINEGRSQKCTRLAMAIGTDANKQVLNQFLAGTQEQLFQANDATRIKEFFKIVTMTTTDTVTTATSKPTTTKTSNDSAAEAARNSDKASKNVEIKHDSCNDLFNDDDE